MKGLLLKDVYLIGKYCKMFFVMDIIFIVIFLLGNGYETIFFSLFPCMFSGTISISLIAYDEHEKWDAYSQTLPCTRAQMVSSKYLIGLCASSLVILAVVVCQAVKMAITDGVVHDFFDIISLMISMSLLTPTLIYPLVFKFGAEKGRIFYYIVIGFTCAIFAIFINSGLINSTKFPLDIILLPISVILYILSWQLSIYFYKRREI